MARPKIGSDRDDPNTVYRDGGSFRMNHFSLAEIHASNPVQFVLLLLAIASALLNYRKATDRRALCFTFGLVASFLCFSALIIWQVWSSRYELPLFVVGSALTGYILEKRFSRKVGTAVGILLVVFAVPFVLANRQRSLVPLKQVDDVYHPRSVLYFNDTHEDVAQVYIAAADAVNKLNCGEIGIDSYIYPADEGHDPRSFFLYPVLAMIRADGVHRRVRYLGVHNRTSRYSNEGNHPAPCAVICFDCTNVPTKSAEYKRAGWRASVSDFITVYSRPASNPRRE